LEARLWNDIFVFSQKYIQIPVGSIRATALIETLLASFELEEILYELRDHSAGFNVGRWDYIFSYIKTFINRPSFVLPDRDSIGMTQHMMTSYVKLVIDVCHKRGVHAIGGMAAQIPIKGDEKANQISLQKVRDDKEREAALGHDGTWIAHPGLLKVAQEGFDKFMKGKNQISKKREPISISREDLLTVPVGELTLEGLKDNLRVSILYLEAWLRGIGCVAINNKMEDLATAEISRSQIMQWIRHGASTSCGKKITLELVERELKNEAQQILKKNPKITSSVAVSVHHLSFLFRSSHVSFVPFLPNLSQQHLLSFRSDLPRL